ncbi:Serine/threonine-protein phosphatase 6 regulatory ankyrin repeat subunit A [Irineochytrium annulatum]|nr:Serine/threonine-protein phosphatase 6 regulatory ankyrin repeat subunit A [Irineochytrium annulatum]
MQNQGMMIADTDEGGCTCLHYAASEADLGIIKYLITQGDRTEIQAALSKKIGRTEDTILHIATRSENAAEMLAYLIPLLPAEVTPVLDSRGRENPRRKWRGAVATSGTTLVHQACSSGRVEIFNYIMSMIPPTVNLSAVDDEGWRCVHYAAFGGSLPILAILMSKGEAVDSRTRDGRTILHIATARGEVEMLKFAGSLTPSALTEATNFLWTCQHFAIQSGDKDALEYLISKVPPSTLDILRYLVPLMPHTITVNTTDSNGYACIHFAMMEASLKMTDYLLSCGADLSIKTDRSRTYLHTACSYDRPVDLDRLIAAGGPFGVGVETPDGTGKTCLHWAAALGNAWGVEKLLSVGVSVEVDDADGMNALLYACGCFGGSLSSVKALAKRRPALLVESKRKADAWTCVFFAAKRGSIEIVNNLIETVKHRLDILDANGCSLLEVACGGGQLKMLKFLMPKLAPAITLQTSDLLGESCIFHGVRGGNHDVVNFLLEEGCDIKARNSKGGNLLQVSCANGHAEVLQGLLTKLPAGADLTLETMDNDGLNCVHHAARGGEKSLIEFVVDNAPGAVKVKTKEGLTALHIAVIANRLSLLPVLIPHLPMYDYETPDNKGWTCLHHAVNTCSKELVEFLLLQTGAVAVPPNKVEELLKLVPAENADVLAWFNKRSMGEDNVSKTGP